MLYKICKGNFNRNLSWKGDISEELDFSVISAVFFKMAAQAQGQNGRKLGFNIRRQVYRTY